VVGVVGQVTHNKALSMAGLVIGGIGGLGALASGAGLLGDGSGIFGAAPTTAAGADAASAGTLDSVVNATAGTWNSTSGVTSGGVGGAVDSGTWDAGASAGAGTAGGVDTVDQATGDVITAPAAAGGGPAAASTDTVNPAIFATKAEAVNPADTSSLPAAGDVRPAWEAAATPPPSVPGPQPGAGGPGAVPAGTSTPAPPSLGEVSKTGNTGLAAPGSGSDGASSGWGTGLLDFANKNPVVALGVLQSAGSALSGAFSTLTPAQVNAYNAQAAANDAAAALTKQQTANLNMPKSVAQSAPVTGSAQLVPIAAQPPPPAAKPGFYQSGAGAVSTCNGSGGMTSHPSNPAVPNSLLQAQKASLAQQQRQLADQLAATRESAGRQEAGQIAATAATQEQGFWIGLQSSQGFEAAAKWLVFDPAPPATPVAPIRTSDGMVGDVGERPTDATVH
jgi:hypothetical protein